MARTLAQSPAVDEGAVDLCRGTLGLASRRRRRRPPFGGEQCVERSRRARQRQKNFRDGVGEWPRAGSGSRRAACAPAARWPRARGLGHGARRRPLASAGLPCVGRGRLSTLSASCGVCVDRCPVLVAVG
eukprot:6932480-Alexandrium_andersonii.AAC.1